MKKKKNKEAKELAKKKKKATSEKKKVAKALEWSDIEKIENNLVWLKRGNTRSFVAGVKINPRDILIDSETVQKNVINNLRIAFNKFGSRNRINLYWGFVFTPVDIDEHISVLLKEEEAEENIYRKNMIRNDFDKAIWFQENYRELEFCFMIKEKDDQKLFKEYNELVAEISHAGFGLKQMTNEDFYDYIAYLYENPLINDFYFSRGVFDCLMSDQTSEVTGKIYDPDFDYDDFYNDPDMMREGEANVEQ